MGASLYRAIKCLGGAWNDEVLMPCINAFLSGSNVVNITIQNQRPSDPVGRIGMFDDSPAPQNVLNKLSSTFLDVCRGFIQ